MSILSAEHFHDEAKAYDFVEALIWPEGPVCPHCMEKARISKMKGKSTRIGTYKCYACRKPFTVKIGSIFEASHIPMRIWLQAIFLLSSSKKGMSSNQLHRALGVTLKSAWFMSHRIREAMRSGSLAPMGGGGGIVEVDETFIGKKVQAPKVVGGYAHKNAVLTLVSRDGEARSFHIDQANQESIMPIIRRNLASEAKVVTDDAGFYRNLDKEYMHAFVNHSAGQYGRGIIHTNTIEGYYSIFKRGMKGVYQHCSERHLHRYLAEFDFRYSNRVKLGVNDEARATRAIKGAPGKRLTYREAI
ncbi:IS1595 family transposase [Hyphomicrobium sp.]|uniref:IS1595 family transposase n=1 Tax=Hyphomicrobium sp. TaxID=82 RepID=UPI001E0AD65D|nr:IS1595 family transposase [Hyphomicrobium sp.]MBY0561566.1 IS1595 family transposase [Hyphomicrobium sp.]